MERESAEVLTPAQELARGCRSPADMGSYMDGAGYMRPLHVDHMSRVVAAAIRESVENPQPTGSRIIFEMPPRHGKSDLGSWRTPVWALELWPHLQVLHASYEKDFSAKWGKKVRDTFERDGDRFTTLIDREKRGAGEWYTMSGGGMACSGVGGPLTGRGADVLVIDDPIKNRAEANSDVVRNSLWDWFTSTAYTRIEPGGVCIVIMTRWHEDDLVGRLLSDPDMAGVWTRIRYPAVAEEADDLGRAVGDPLWPARYGLDSLLGAADPENGGARDGGIRRAVGRSDWASLYQQHPSPAGGAVFERKHFRYGKQTTHEYVVGDQTYVKTSCSYFHTIDTAMKDGEDNDFTVVMQFCVTPGGQGRVPTLGVVGIARAKVTVGSQLSFCMAQRDRWERWPGWLYQAVEDAGSGVGLIEAMRQRGLPVKELKHRSRDKVTRSAPTAILFEQGAIWFLADMPELEDFEDELLFFPNGKHDDMVDCLTYGGELLGVRQPSVWDGDDAAPMERYRPKTFGEKLLGGMRPVGGMGP